MHKSNLFVHSGSSISIFLGSKLQTFCKSFYIHYKDLLGVLIQIAFALINMDIWLHTIQLLGS